MTNYNAVSVNQNDNRDTVKRKQNWNNGQYNRNLYGSDDSIKPTPNTGLISLKKEDVEGTSKMLFRLRHCFDYYKDLSDSSGFRHTDDNLLINYLQGDDKYFTITKDMYLNVSCDEGQFTFNCKNKEGISYWKDQISSGGKQVNWYDIGSNWFTGNKDYSYEYHYIYPVFTRNLTFKNMYEAGYRRTRYHAYDWVMHCSTKPVTVKVKVGSWMTGYSFEDTTYYVLDQLWKEKVDYGLVDTTYGTSNDNQSNLIGIFSRLGWVPSAFLDKKYYPLGVLLCSDSKKIDMYKTNNSRFETETKYNCTNNLVTHYDLSGYYNYYSTIQYNTPNEGKGIVAQTNDGNVDTSKYYSDPDTNNTYIYETWETTLKKRNDKIIYDEENNYRTYGASPYNYYFYVSYKDVPPYIITRNDIISNHNYYMQDFKNLTVVDYSSNTDFWGNVTSYDIHHHGNDNYVLGGLLHKYCFPTICPYNDVYNGFNEIDIGSIFIKYNMIKPGSQNVPDSKTIPVKFTAYKCEAYKKK